MAIGAWTVPWYQGELSRGLLNDIDAQFAEVNSSVGDVLNNQVGTGLEGDTNLATLAAAGADQTTLQNVMGTEFTTFQNQFLEFDPLASDFQSFDVITFELAQSREKVPFSLVGQTVTEVAASNPTNVATRCQTAGTLIENDGKFDLVGGGPGSFSQVGGPSNIYGFAIQAPTVADFDGGGGGTATTAAVQIQICIDDATLPNPVIADELIQMDIGEIVTKNFEYGLIPPGLDLKVIIDDDGAANGGGQAYHVWIFRSDPTFETIPFINDDLGNLAATACPSVTVEVTDSGGVNGVSVDDSRVEMGHFFLPVFGEGFTAGGGTHGASTIVFDAASLGLPIMPGGPYFIDVFGPGGEFPFFADITCDNITGPVTVDADLVDAASFIAGLGGGFGDLQINIVDQFDVPITNTISFIDAGFAPIIYDVCEDGGAGVCFDNLTDFIVIGTLVDTAADGSFTITGMPTDPASPDNTGIYFVEVCAPGFFCNFTPVTITSGQLTTLDITIFLPV